MRVSDERLAEIERRLWVVTPGPKHDYDEDFCGMCKDDAIFCANAYTDVADLLAEVRRLKEMLDVLKPGVYTESWELIRPNGTSATPDKWRRVGGIDADR